MTGWAPLRRFVTEVEAALAAGRGDNALLAEVKAAMAALVAAPTGIRFRAKAGILEGLAD